MKNNEKADMSVTNLRVIAAENTNVDPKTKFITKMSTGKEKTGPHRSHPFLPRL